MTILSHNIEDYPDGIVLVIDKPYRWTSADVVRKVKYAAIRHFGKKKLKVGHAGTLDPLASGIVVVCIGPATRKAESIQAGVKAYETTFCLGAVTPSYDLEKDIDAFFPLDGITREKVEETLALFVGEQQQRAPLFSAKSVDGTRAYTLARSIVRSGGGSEALSDEGESLIKTSTITIESIEILDWADHGFPERQIDPLSEGASSRINVASYRQHSLPEVRLKIVCSKGTYIRSIARDLGEKLGCGAFVSELRRTRCGQYEIDDALSITDVLSLFE